MNPNYFTNYFIEKKCVECGKEFQVFRK